MKTAEELKNIAFNECFEMLGLDLVKKYQRLCGYSCGLDERGFVCVVNLETNEGSYKASVIVDPNTGEVERNLKNSVLPKGQIDETNNQELRETL